MIFSYIKIEQNIFEFLINMINSNVWKWHFKSFGCIHDTFKSFIVASTIWLNEEGVCENTYLVNHSLSFTDTCQLPLLNIYEFEYEIFIWKLCYGKICHFLGFLCLEHSNIVLDIEIILAKLGVFKTLRLNRALWFVSDLHELVTYWSGVEHFISNC